jgi:hypothetical protein
MIRPLSADTMAIAFVVPSPTASATRSEPILDAGHPVWSLVWTNGSGSLPATVHHSSHSADVHPHENPTVGERQEASFRRCMNTHWRSFQGAI